MLKQEHFGEGVSIVIPWRIFLLVRCAENSIPITAAIVLASLNRTDKAADLCF